MISLAPTSRAPRNIAQDVVDLVRIVGAPGADHRVGPGLQRQLGHDLGRRVGERHHQRIARHALEHGELEDAAGREAEENVGAGNNVRERARARLPRVDRLPAVHQFLAALIDDALDVADHDVLALGAKRDNQIEGGDRRSARARADVLDLADPLAGKLERVDDCCGDDNGRAMLIVVEYGNAHAGLGLLLDLETFRTLDVLEIDAAERRLERDDDVDELVDVQFRDFNVEHVDSGEFLEQDRLAFHHRLGRERPDRSKSEHGRPVGQHRDEILARGQRRRGVGVGCDRLAGKGDARRISERQVALIGERLVGDDLELAGPRLAVELQGVGFEIGRAFLGRFAPRLRDSSDCCPIGGRRQGGARGKASALFLSSERMSLTFR